MGLGTERYTAGGTSREDQDAFAATTHERAAAAIKDGRFADEIVAVGIPQRKGDPLVVEHDEGVRPGTTVESLGGCAPHSTRQERSRPATPASSPTVAAPSS